MLRICIVLIIAGSVLCDEFPDSIQKCKPGDSKCLSEVMTTVIQSSAKGIPEIGLSATDPLHLARLNFSPGADNPVNVKVKLREADLFGLSRIKIYKVEGFEKDPKNSKFIMHGSLAVASVEGPYTISGRVLLLEITGKGHTNLTFENLDFFFSFKTSTEIRDGEEYLNIEKADFDFKLKRLYLDFENLFNNKELSDSMNKVLNENNQLIIPELRNELRRLFNEKLMLLVPPVFKKFPYRKLFLE